MFLWIPLSITYLRASTCTCFILLLLVHRFIFFLDTYAVLRTTNWNRFLDNEIERRLANKSSYATSREIFKDYTELRCAPGRHPQLRLNKMEL